MMKAFYSVIWADLKYFTSETWLYFFGALAGILIRERSMSGGEAMCSWFLALVFALATWPMLSAFVRWIGNRQGAFTRYVFTIMRDEGNQRFILDLPSWIDGLPPQQQSDVIHSQIKGQIR